MSDLPTDVDVSVVVVLYRSADCIADCLLALPESAAGRTSSVTYEVVLVDNCSPDAGLDAALAVCPHALVVKLAENRGFAGGVNAGVARTSGRYICLLNPDTIPQPGCLPALVEFADRYPEYQVYGGRTITPSGALDPRSCWGLPSLWGYACFATGLSTMFRRWRLFDPESLGHWKRDSVREVGAVSGCLLMTPRTFLRTMGGLDEAYFMYGEDIDFAVRARRAGARPVVNPAAVVMHLGGASSTTVSKAAMVLRGKVTYVRRQWPQPRANVAIVLLTIGVGLRAATARLTGRGAQWREVWSLRREWRHGWSTGLGAPTSPALSADQ